MLLLDPIGNGHGKLDLSLVHGRAEKCISEIVHKLKAEIAEENNIISSFFREKVCLFADTFTYVSNCYRK